MRLDLLETYAAVVGSGTTQGAAAQLGITQSAVSRRLAQLECSLGIALFRREKSRLVPTRDSAILHDQIAALIESARRLASRAGELRSGNSPELTLSVAFPASLALSIVPRIVARFLESYARVRLEVHTGPYDAIERMLLDRRAEIGFLRLPTSRPGLATIPVIASRTVCVMPRGHPLAARDRVSVEDLRDVPMILLGRMRAPRREIDALFATHNLHPNIRIEAHSVASACGLAASGIGVTLVNELMANDFAGLPVEIRHLKEEILHDFAFAHAVLSPLDTVARSFIAVATRTVMQGTT